MQDRENSAAPMRRRQFLAAGASALGLAACQTQPSPEMAEPLSHRPRPGSVFSLGVASGEPTPDDVVLWTRLARDPLNGGGMPAESVPVRWELASDEAFARIVRRGEELARPEWAHSVHVAVGGLQPSRWYWYRFHARGETSPTGRTRTAPAPGAALPRLRFAAASCQDFQNGYYSAYRHMAHEDLDFVLHLGDYIYEYGARPGRARRHIGGETTTLADYRNRYAQYRADPDLQAAHAAFPWLAVWDDHEVENDYADDRSEKRTERDAFLRRRAAAYRVYYEHMPLHPRMAPVGPTLPLYRRRSFGALLELFLLDGRQYRSDQACPGPRWGGQVIDPSRCPELADSRRTMLGAAQERWLAQSSARVRATWTAIGQQMLMAPLIQPTATGEPGVWSDGWDGYPAARRRLLEHFAAARVPNPVVLGGDIHSYWVSELRADMRDERGPALATEFVATSISSSSIPQSIIDAGLKLPHIKFAAAGRHGYLRCSVTPRLWQTDLQTVDTIASPQAKLSTLASFAVEAGRHGPQAA